MAERIQAIRGMNDALPESTRHWQRLESVLASTLGSYGYSEIRFPIVESTQLFKRTIGDVTDIIEKEMYTFTDLNGESISLRPEGTAGCVRACLEHGLLHNQHQKLWYMGPMFRHEKPQKGRYRQFNQLGVEAFGISGTAIELELIALSARMWRLLGFSSHVRLEINSLGQLNERHQYRSLLVEYFKSHYDALDEESKTRLERNPLRILDSKNPDLRDVILQAPKLVDVISNESKAHFEAVCKGLDALGIPYHINPTLVRGLDYYGETVFEWVTDKLGSQATICAGGRYDILVEQLGGTATPAVGFALGLERLLLLMETLDLLDPVVSERSVFIVPGHPDAMWKCLELAECIRQELPGLTVHTNTAGGSFKSQFKKADKSGARLALIIGEEELHNHQITIKDLRQESDQIRINTQEVVQFLQDYSI